MSSAWVEATAPDGRLYYYHNHTKKTTWEKPEEFLTPEERALARLPWKEYTAPDGRKYWSHSESKESTWDMPQEYRNALARAQTSGRPSSQAQQFVAGPQSSSASQRDEFPPDRRESERRDFTSTNGIPVTISTQEQTVEYSTFEEAEAAFLKVLKKYNVDPDWTWEQTMRATIKDPTYRALKDPKDRKAAFEKYAIEVRQQEKERAKERLAKLRADFGTMLRRHSEIKHYSRWKTVRPMIAGETIFRSTDDESERRQLFDEYILELKKSHVEYQSAARKSALTDLVAILKTLDLEPYTRWAEAQKVIQSNERIQSDAKFETLSKSEILTTFEDHMKFLERSFNDARQQEKASKARRERQTRDRFIALLSELRSQGKIKAGTKWMNLLPEIEEDPRYVGMLGQAGSTPMDLFWDIVEEEERALRGKRNHVYDVLEDKRYEMTTKTTFEEFVTVMNSDKRTADLDTDDLQLIFDRLYEKVVKRNEEEKHAADRQQRRAVDALRSRVKRLEPPIKQTDTWEEVRARVEGLVEFNAIESEELRKSAYEKTLKRMKEKEEDAERERERRRARRADDRDYRNGYREPRSGRLSKSPEADAYEADRRKAMADREKQYRKTSGIDVSPRPVSRGGREYREDRYGRLDRTPPPRRLSNYDRERRDREEERERIYRVRADPRSSRDELNYGEESRSVASSDRRRRRGGDSDGESIGSGRRTKRYRRERRADSREKSTAGSPEAKKDVPEPAGVHSGSEEGEIEED